MKTPPNVMPNIASARFQPWLRDVGASVAEVAVVVMVSVVSPVAPRVAGEKTHLAPVGRPEQLKLTEPVNPSKSVIAIDIDPEAPGDWIARLLVEG